MWKQKEIKTENERRQIETYLNSELQSKVLELKTMIYPKLTICH